MQNDLLEKEIPTLKDSVKGKLLNLKQNKPLNRFIAFANRNNFGKYSPSYLGSVTLQNRDYFTRISKCDVVINKDDQATFIKLDKDHKIKSINTLPDITTGNRVSIILFMNGGMAITFFDDMLVTTQLSPQELVDIVFETAIDLHLQATAQNRRLIVRRPNVELDNGLIITNKTLVIGKTTAGELSSNYF
jgi:hypothetical protein